MLDTALRFTLRTVLFLRLRLIPAGLDRPDEATCRRLHLAPPSRKDGYFLEPRRGGAVFLLSCVCEIEKSILARVLGIGAGWRGATETRLSVRCSVRAALRRYGACLARDGCTLPRMSVLGKATQLNQRNGRQGVDCRYQPRFSVLASVRR